jgi:hypothetical protein
LNEADVPWALMAPALPEPARVVTAPALVIFRIA